MLSTFDWIRRSQTGAELLATLRVGAGDEQIQIKEDDGPSSHETSIGPPLSALSSPCHRCWVYPRTRWPEQADLYCPFCKDILIKARKLGAVAQRAAVIWGFVNQLPKTGLVKQESPESPVLGTYLHDSKRFLLIIKQRRLRPWLQQLVLYHGTELKGLLQIFPTVGATSGICMGDVLCRAIHHESRFAMDQLRVRFYSAPYQLIRPHEREQKGILTFDASEFLSLLEMAKVFRTLVRPREQDMLYELLQLEDPTEVQFYWGRIQGLLDQEVKDMLTAWRIRQWPKTRVKLLYELTNYVVFDESH